MYDMEMPAAGIIRPIIGACRIVCDQFIRSRGDRVCLAVATALSMSVAIEAVAQNPSSGSPFIVHAIQHAEVGARVQPILSLRAIGTPVRLADGRYEQRYQVIANIAFRFVSVRDTTNEVRCAAESREVALSEFAGTAGYHAELRIRSADPAALSVSVAARPRTMSALSLGS